MDLFKFFFGWATSDCSHVWGKWEVVDRGITCFWQERECIKCGFRVKRKEDV